MGHLKGKAGTGVDETALLHQVCICTTVVIYVGLHKLCHFSARLSGVDEDESSACTSLCVSFRIKKTRFLYDKQEVQFSKRVQCLPHFASIQG